MTEQPEQPDWKAFWTERLLCQLATRRPDGTTHLVPVVVTYDEQAGIARIITRDGSTKVRNIEAAAAAGDGNGNGGGDVGGAWVAVSQADRGRWTTLEGTATVRRDPASVAEAVRRYAERYPQPAPNPQRVAIEIRVRRVMGSVKVPLPADAG